VREIGLDRTHAIALGAGVLGTGGGGNTYLGRMWLDRELRARGSACRVIDADEVSDDGLVCAVGSMGAPTVGIEKIPRGDELVNAVRALEEHLGTPFEALVIGEIGGSNALRPLICGLQMDLPIVDGDGMGRAFPELQMDTFAIGGLDLSPLALGDCQGNVAILHRVRDPEQAERYARNLTIEMGGSAALAMPTMTGRELKALLIRDTLSLAERLGRAILNARTGGDPVAAVAEAGGGTVLFRGKIVDVERRTTEGFARGRIVLAAFGHADDRLEIDFQNENLIAWRNGEAVCTVPDLITLLDLEDGEPIGTEMLRYGLRVAVVGMPAPRELKTPQALAVVGPGAFGYPEVPFSPLPGDLL
jgi:DUF917 family protein